MNTSRRVFLSIAVATSCAGVYAQDRGKPEEARALLAKAVALIKSNGKDKSFSQFMDKQGGFVDRDLYITVYDMSGKTLAHGANPRVVGKDNLNIQDADGKFIIKDRLDAAKSKGRGTQEYNWINPVSKAIEAKVVYFEKVEDVVVASGSFKP